MKRNFIVSSRFVLSNWRLTEIYGMIQCGFRLIISIQAFEI